MNRIDVEEIRAQLRAAEDAQRPPPGPLSALRSLVGAKKRPSLLPPRPAWEVEPGVARARPKPRPPAPPEIPPEDEPMLLEAALPPPRRQMFGQRGDLAEGPPPPRVETETSDIPEDPRPPPAPGGPEIDWEAVEKALLGGRRRAPVEPAPQIETPFMPEDLQDQAGPDLPYEEPRLQATEADRSDETGLKQLEMRLMEEHMRLIRVLAGR